MMMERDSDRTASPRDAEGVAMRWQTMVFGMACVAVLLARRRHAQPRRPLRVQLARRSASQRLCLHVIRRNTGRSSCAEHVPLFGSTRNTLFVGRRKSEPGAVHAH